jgi:hypothetical protein
VDVEAVVNQAAQSGFPPNVSDAHTINGHPGPVPGCSSQGTEMGISSQFIFVFTKKHMKKKKQYFNANMSSEYAILTCIFKNYISV